MQQLSIFRLIGRRVADDWKLLVSVFIGIAMATTLAAGTPVYLNALDQLAFNASLDRIESPLINLSVSAPSTVLAETTLRESERLLKEAIDRNLSPVYNSHERHLKGANWLGGSPTWPFPEGGGSGVLLSRGYFQLLTGLESHSRFVDGRMASATTTQGARGPKIEGVVSTQTAQAFGLSVGQEVDMGAVLGDQGAITVVITGVLEPDNPADQYWQNAAEIIDPPPLDEPTGLLVQVDPDEPPLAVFIREEIMLLVGGDPEQAQFLGAESYFRSPTWLAGIGDRPFPEGAGTGVFYLIGYFLNLSNLEKHVTFNDGRMSGDSVSMGPKGPVLEGVVLARTALKRRLSVGDVLTLSPTLGAATIFSIEVVGIVEPDDLRSPYWIATGIYSDPATPEAEVPLLVQPDDERAPVQVAVTERAMLQAVNMAYPGALVTPRWPILVDKGRLKDWSPSEARRSVRAFEDDIIEAFPGAKIDASFIGGITDVATRRSFFTRVPLLLLLTVMVVTVLIFLTMMVSYLADSRDADTALWRTRGAGSPHLLRLYSLEGLVMAAVATIVAPFIAYIAVALAGFLPFFSEMTGGGIMPVRFSAEPFLLALGVGALCLIIFVLPGATGARGALLLQRLRAARPVSVPFIHRYFLDVAVLVLGGLVFWEFEQRGHVISGGLFKEVDVNEVLLLAPVLFLIAVALVFIRLFPMVVRYIAGESTALVNTFASATIGYLVAAIAWRRVREGGGGEAWMGPGSLLLAVALVYWATARTRDGIVHMTGILVQSLLVAGFLYIEPLATDEPLTFVPTIALAIVVPAQLVFLVFRGLTRSAPVWLSMGLWHMSRSPLQYTWLVLLLVLVTGLGILSTTVGGTLERSHLERVQYAIPTDILVSGLIPTDASSDILKSRYLNVPGIKSAAMGVRLLGRVGPVTVQVLGLESNDFSHFAWFRDDFSTRPLPEIMADLAPDAALELVAVPQEATSVGMWVKPIELNPLTSIFIDVEHGDGRIQPVYLGEAGAPEWTLLRAELPADMVPPFHLLSVHIFDSGSPGAGGGVGASPGSFLVDDIHYTVGENDQEHILEDFEGTIKWRPVVTSELSSDRIFPVEDGAFRGRSLGFTFGSRTVRGFRGFYLGPAEAGPLPVIVSASLAASTGHDVGSAFVTHVSGQWVPVVVRDIVDYFPTLSPAGGGFMIMDMDNLLARLNVLLDFYSIKPNEIFLEESLEDHEVVLAGVEELVGRSGQVFDGTIELEELRQDPFVSAGWRPMVILSPGIGVLAAVMGYITYLLLFAKRSLGEMGSLQSMGLSRLQLGSLLSFEHLTIVAIGLGLGTWAGFQMSRMMVSPLAVTETGDPVLPPFLLTTNWALLVPTYIILVGIFVAALVALNRGIRRPSLHTIARMGEA